MELDPSIILYAVILIVLLVGGAFFSAVETALIAVSRHRLKMLAEKHPDKAAGMHKWLDDPNRLLTTMLIGINVVAITSAIVTESIAHLIFVEHLHWPAWTSKVFAMGVVSIVVIEFCEIIPKIVAYHSAEKWTLRLVKPLVFIDWLFSPVGKAMVGFGNWVIQLFGGDTEHSAPLMTEAELLRIIKTGEKQGVIDPEEREMIQSVLQLEDTEVREVMVPRPDMTCAKLPMTITEMAKFMDEAAHSRIPVFQDSVDNIVGIVNTRMLVGALRKGLDNDDVRSIMGAPHFVPESKKLDVLLQELQEKRIHMAIVVDEYGDAAGIVTIEDLLEEIVGEIRDEYDTEEPLFRWVGTDCLRVDARINVNELEEVLDADLPEDEAFETLGGLLFDLMGKVPRRGESVEYNGYEFVIERMTGRRIATVLIRLKERADQTEKPNEEHKES